MAACDLPQYKTIKYSSGCSAVGSAPALGAGCRGFESLHSDQKKSDDPCGQWTSFFSDVRDSNPERVRSVKKTIRRIVFSDEGCGGYCCKATVAATEGFAQQTLVPPLRPKEVRQPLRLADFFLFRYEGLEAARE